MGKSAYAGNFKAPFFLVWFGTCWMIVIFPISVPFYFLANRRLPTCSGLLELWRYILNFSLFSVSLFLHFFSVWTYFTFVLFCFLLLFPPSLFPTSLPPSSLPSLFSPSSHFLSPYSHSRDIINPPGSSSITFLTSTVLFSLIWMPTNYLYARALISMAPTDVTALFSTAPAFVFLLSMLLLREPPLILRVSSTSVCDFMCVCVCVLAYRLGIIFLSWYTCTNLVVHLL